ncbi:MAG: hypothetical protein ACI9LM_005520, partial [Alteromonadaceae bacterium]
QYILCILLYLAFYGRFVRISDIHYGLFFRSLISQLRTLSLCKFRSIFGAILAKIFYSLVGLV